MRFSEWQEKLGKQQDRLNDLALSEVSESISIPGSPAGRSNTGQSTLVEITIGKGTYDVCINGKNLGLRFLRSLYTNNKEAFDGQTGSLKLQEKS